MHSYKGIESGLFRSHQAGYHVTGVKIKRAVAQTRIPFSGSLKHFLFINLGKAEDQQCQLFEPKGRVLALPGASLRFIKKRFRTNEKGFGQQPAKM
jgi:hypothetical protein